MDHVGRTIDPRDAYAWLTPALSRKSPPHDVQRAQHTEKWPRATHGRTLHGGAGGPSTPGGAPTTTSVASSEAVCDRLGAAKWAERREISDMLAANLSGSHRAPPFWAGAQCAYLRVALKDAIKYGP